MDWNWLDAAVGFIFGVMVGPGVLLGWIYWRRPEQRDNVRYAAHLVFNKDDDR